MKKILLSLGTVTAIVAPVVSVVACGKSDFVKIEVQTSYDENKKMIILDLKPIAEIVFQKPEVKEAIAHVKSLITSGSSTNSINKDIQNHIDMQEEYMQSILKQMMPTYKTILSSFYDEAMAHPDATSVCTIDYGWKTIKSNGSITGIEEVKVENIKYFDIEPNGSYFINVSKINGVIEYGQPHVGVAKISSIDIVVEGLKLKKEFTEDLANMDKQISAETDLTIKSHLIKNKEGMQYIIDQLSDEHWAGAWLMTN